MSVPQRIRFEILRLAREAGVVENRAVITPAPNREAMAMRINTVRYAVSKEITALAKEGMLQKVARSLVVKDVRRLEDRARGMSE